MGMISNGKITMVGNFTRPKRYKDGKPKNWMDRDWKAIIPYPFEWRAKLGKVECNCKEVIEAYQPYYGSTFSHSDDCAVMVHFRKHPQMQNIGDFDPNPMAMTC